MASVLNIQKDDLDKPDAVDPGPAYPGYRQRRDEPPRTRLPAQAWLMLIGGALLVLAFFLWMLYRFAVRWSEAHPDLVDLLGALLWAGAMLTVGAGVIGAILYGHAKITAVQARSKRELIVRDRADNPINIEVLMDRALAYHIWQAQFAAATHAEVLMAPSRQHLFVKTLTEGDHEEAHTEINAAGDEAQPPALVPDGGPMLGQLRKRYAKSAEHLFVGTVGDTPVHLRWGAAGLSAIAGGSGGGKTNTTRLIAAWHALNGGGLALCDGHGEVDEGLIPSCAALAEAYVLPPAVKAQDIAQVIRRMDAIGRARLAGTEPKDIPLLLVVDEFTSLCRNHSQAAELINCLLNFGDEYRKVNMQALIIGHHWRGDLIDKQLGAALRSAIGARIIHATAPEEAKFLLRPAEAQGVDRLRVGEALFFDRAGDVQRIVVPWLPAEALREVRYPVHPGWPLPLETPQQDAREKRKAEVKAKIAALSYEQRLTELRKALALRGNTRTGYKYTTDYLREMFAIDQRVLIALSQEVRGGKMNGIGAP